MVDSLRVSKAEVQLSKRIYITPAVVLFAAVNTYFCYMYGICKSLYSYYSSNMGGHQKVWMSEGMPSESVSLSMQSIGLKKTRLNTLWIDVLIERAFHFLIIMFTENRWMVNEYKLEYLLELGLIACFGFGTFSSALDGLHAGGNVLPIFLAFGILFGVYYLTKKRLLKSEMLLYFPIALNLLSNMFLYFIATNPVPINYSYSIENYKEISPTLRSRMMSLCKKYDIDTNNVVINQTADISAGSIRLYQFKLIVINSALVDALTEDQTMAVLCHEIKHILCFDSMKRQIKDIVESALSLAYAFSLYKTITLRCSGLVAAFIYYNSRFVIDPLLEGGYNFFLGHNEELICDSHSVKEGLRKPMEEGLKLIALICNGMFFDFNTPHSLLNEHPSMYKRIKAIRQC